MKYELSLKVRQQQVQCGMHMRDEASSFFNSNVIVEMQTQDQDPLLSKGEVERLSAIHLPCNGRPN